MVQAILPVLFSMTLAAPVPQQVPAGSFHARAVRAAAPPEIVGEVGETEWAGAPVFADFIPSEPIHRLSRARERSHR